MIANRIPGGLIGNSTEFFTQTLCGTTEPMCLKGGRLYNFSTMPSSMKSIVYADMKQKPTVERAMEGIVGTDEEMKLRQYLMCRYGALNDEADIDADGNLSEPEYVPCTNRGICKFEGIGCSSIMVDNHTYLSKAETEVFKLVQLADKLIADHLFISVETVKKHFQNIRKKTGFNTKIEMAIWATQKGII